jgi:hypothetical protein
MDAYVYLPRRLIFPSIKEGGDSSVIHVKSGAWLS